LLFFYPRCTKDVIEEDLFSDRHDLFMGLDCVFFDTTSIYFEGDSGQTVGEYGYSKDHRPDLMQMVFPCDKGHPVCCQMWPGNTTDLKSLIPVVDRLKNQFHIRQFCVQCGRGMISQSTLDWLEAHNIFYILGARMRNNNVVKKDVLS
jgi:transposase